MPNTSGSLTGFFLALRESIINAGVLPELAVQITEVENYLQYSTGQYAIIVMPGALVPIWQDGCAEPETVFSGDMTFRIVAQTALDSPFTDVIALADGTTSLPGTTIGLYMLLESLLDVVRFWQACDEAGNNFLIEPMHVLSGVPRPARDEKHPQYMYLDLACEYKICITQSIK
jgi:hypothetical protein